MEEEEGKFHTDTEGHGGGSVIQNTRVKHVKDVAN